MTIDGSLEPALLQYVEATTSPEPTLLAQCREQTALQIGQSQMLCGPIIGSLLHLLIKLSQAKHCLELGTFTGYSSLWIASALPEDGRLITCEKNKNNAKFAQSFFNKSPHGHKIQLQLGPAAESIVQLSTCFDLIFIDADKANYPLYYETLVPKLNPNGIMVIDNALRGGEVVHPREKSAIAIDALNRQAVADPRVETVMLAIRDGILLVRKKPDFL